MKLYSLPHSPYAARVRIQIESRRLPVTVEPPPGGLGSAQFKAITPTGKVPTLQDGDQALSESAAIMEFLEDAFAENPLLPTDAWARGQQRALLRHLDIVFAPALFPLFQQLSASERDADIVAKGLDNLREQLAALEAWFSVQGLFGDSLSFADCALAPMIFYVTTLAPLFGEPEILAATPLLSEHWQRLQGQAAVAGVLQEMRDGLKAMMGG